MCKKTQFSLLALQSLIRFITNTGMCTCVFVCLCSSTTSPPLPSCAQTDRGRQPASDWTVRWSMVQPSGRLTSKQTSTLDQWLTICLEATEQRQWRHRHYPPRRPRSRRRVERGWKSADGIIRAWSHIWNFLGIYLPALFISPSYSAAISSMSSGQVSGWHMLDVTTTDRKDSTSKRLHVRD